MSPTRRKRQPIPHRRSRAEIVKAVAVGAAIVGATALFVWLMRPGPAGVPATGGLMNRQPRSSWLVALAVGAALSATWWILRGGRRARRHAKVALPVTLGVIAAATVGAGFAWPGGLLRHDVAPAPPPTTPTTTPAPATTASPATTTTTGASTSTTGEPTTTSGATPTTGSPSTTGPRATTPST